jgi:hypothetical protein
MFDPDAWLTERALKRRDARGRLVALDDALKRFSGALRGATAGERSGGVALAPNHGFAQLLADAGQTVADLRTTEQDLSRREKQTAEIRLQIEQIKKQKDRRRSLERELRELREKSSRGIRELPPKNTENHPGSPRVGTCQTAETANQGFDYGTRKSDSRLEAADTCVTPASVPASAIVKEKAKAIKRLELQFMLLAIVLCLALVCGVAWYFLGSGY